MFLAKTLGCLHYFRLLPDVCVKNEDFNSPCEYGNVVCRPNTNEALRKKRPLRRFMVPWIMINARRKTQTQRQKQTKLPKLFQ